MTKTQKVYKLTAKQKAAIPVIVGASTYFEGAKQARISRKTPYGWLKIPEFKAEIDRQRGEIVTEVLGMLSQNLNRAVETLVSLLNSSSERLRRLTAKHMIEHFLKHMELKDLNDRIAAIEARLGERR